MPSATLRAAGPERELYWIFELKKKAQDPHGCKKSVVVLTRSYHCTRAIGAHGSKIEPRVGSARLFASLRAAQATGAAIAPDQDVVAPLALQRMRAMLRYLVVAACWGGGRANEAKHIKPYGICWTRNEASEHNPALNLANLLRSTVLFVASERIWTTLIAKLPSGLPIQAGSVRGNR